MEKKTPSVSFVRSTTANIVTAPKENGQHHCCCGSPNCEKLRARALVETPIGHPWRLNGGFQEIRYEENKPSAKTEALRRSCVYQLHLDPSVLELSIFRVARIHWPPLLLQQSKKRSTPLTRSDAKKEYDSAG